MYKPYLIASLFFLPRILLAQNLSFAGFVGTIVGILSALTLVLIGVALIVFFFGIIKFLSAGGDQQSISEGRKQIIAGIIGMFVLTGLWGIVQIVLSTLELSV